MSGRPALIRSRDIKAIIRAARMEGVKKLIVGVGVAGSVVIPLVPDDTPVAQDANEWAVDDAHKA